MIDVHTVLGRGWCGDVQRVTVVNGRDVMALVTVDGVCAFPSTVKVTVPVAAVAALPAALTVAV